MKGKEFLASKWVQRGNTEAGEKEVSQKYKEWVGRVKNVSIIEKAGQLWKYFTSSETSFGDKGGCYWRLTLLNFTN